MSNRDLKLVFSSFALAPMFGYTNFVFRFLEAKYGANLTFSEFIAAEQICRIQNQDQLLDLLAVPSNCIGGIQLFGSEPEAFELAFKKISELCSSYLLNIKFIDLNLGCPSEKILKIGAGAGLLYSKARLKKIANIFYKYCPFAYSAKLRLLEDEREFFDICSILIKNNFSFLSLHCRTKNEKFFSKPRWEICKKVEEKFNVFVFANGSISKVEDIKFILENYSSGVMIGRAALENPFIFLQARDYLNFSKFQTFGFKDKIKFFFEYSSLIKDRDFSYAKNLSLKLFKNFKNASELRKKISVTTNIEELRLTIQDFAAAFQ
ncbi:MAG: tRNA-dihydrouridine synthase family protein [Candidatus Micrarchaeota archaeon]|nr:tRNA-dihydrouridine synthase family protein [Candidatus Micrarchaeota archaeon]